MAAAANLRLYAEWALVEGQWARDVRVTLRGDGRIQSVHPGAACEPEDERLSGQLLLPAPGNLHSHAFQRAMAGRTEVRSQGGADSFWTWRELMYRFVTRIRPEQLQAIAAQSYMEMLEAGFAAVAEFHYLHHRPDGGGYDQPAELSACILAAAEQAGIGLTHLPVLYQRGGLDGRPPAGGQLRFACDLERYARLHESAATLLRAGPADWLLGTAPHSLRAVDAAGLALAQSLGGPKHIHIAEQTREVEELLQATGARPAEWLMDHAEIDGAWCLVHATHLSDSELRRLAASQAVVGLAPITEANLGDGVFRAADWLALDGRFGVGTDSNVRISLAEELRSCEYSQRLARRERVVLADARRSCARLLFDVACAGGAQALGRESGAIRAGCWADLVTLDLHSVDLASTHGDGWLDAWVFGADARVVTRVWSAGRPVVRDGRHVQRPAIEARYRQVLHELVGQDARAAGA